jgi:hypothetical protein
MQTVPIGPTQRAAIAGCLGVPELRRVLDCSGHAERWLASNPRAGVRVDQSHEEGEGDASPYELSSSTRAQADNRRLSPHGFCGLLPGLIRPALR